MIQRIKNFLLRHLLHAIVASDVITLEKGVVYLGGTKATQAEINQLQAEIKALEGFRIWGIMTNSLRHVAQDKIFNKSTSFEHVTYGKAMLFSLDTQESIIKVVKSRS